MGSFNFNILEIDRHAEECARLIREGGDDVDIETVVTDYAAAQGYDAEDFHELVLKELEERP
jgi:hypothetical protein